MKSTQKKNSPLPKPTNKPTLGAFLLDRSASMTACRDETISGFNHYLKELRGKGQDAMRFTLTQFDSEGIDIIHDAVPLKAVKDLTPETYTPRSMTPLYDAIGRTIRATEKQAGDKYKVLFVTLTDGQENTSHEWTRDSIKVLIKSKEEKSHWTFAYIGVGLEGFAATTQIAVGTMSASNVLKSSHKNTGQAYARFAGATVAYCSSTGNVSASAQNVFGKNPTTEDDPQ